MDFVKTEDQNAVENDNYDVYMNSMQDYQHTAISMEQLHQAMQSTLNTSSLQHSFQLPLSPRQMSTLMLKTNHLSRNLNFNDIPSHLARNLTSDIDLAHNLTSDLTQNLRHDEILNHSLRNSLDVTLSRTLSSEIELQNSLSFSQNISEQDMRVLNVDLSDNLARVADGLPQNLVRGDQSVQDLSHEIDLSQLSRQNVTNNVIANEERRTPTIQSSQQQNLSQRLEQNLLQRLDQNIIQRLDPALIQRLDPNIMQRLDQRLVSGLVQESRVLQDSEPMLQMPFNIKMEQEDDGYFYNMNQQGLVSGNTVNGHIPVQLDQTPASIQENQIYSIYNNHLTNIAGINPVELYSRSQNFAQTYIDSNVSAENPQNLVVHRQFENASPYTLEKERESENSVDNVPLKQEQPKENQKPSDQNKIYYSEYSQNTLADTEKNESLTTDTDKATQDFSMNIKGEYECFKCHKIFPNKRSLKQHAKACIENEEGEEKAGKFSCTQCAYRCQSPAILKIHERTHTGEKPFSCTFCDYKSGQKNNVAKHILVHMKEKPFRCQYCDYRCAQKNNLVVHERTHTGYKPFACPYCDYRTVQKPNLVKHMYLHTDQKPFSCDICNYRCVQKTNLTKHKQRHINDKAGEKLDVKNDTKPYKPRQKSVKCPHCSYRCVQKSSLEKHMQFKHIDNINNSEYSQENIDQELINETYNNETIQNLSVKKEQTVFVDVNQEKSHIEPLQIMS